MVTNRDFASTLAELEEVVAQLDSDIAIEKALELFEHGMKLSHDCEKFLSQAEQRVEILKRAQDGSLTMLPYQAESIETSQTE